MPIARLVVGGFRNLRQTDLNPGRVSFITGPNGSGKTSLLEAISTLALGRSFRTRKFRNLITYGRPELQLFCEFHQAGVSQKLGAVRGQDGSSFFKLNDVPVGSAAELAVVLPCQWINSQSFSLLEGGPGERRHFLDWLVFHVKPDFRRLSADYRNCLKQRNGLLRSGRIQPLELDIWNRALATAGDQIDRLRTEVLDYLFDQTLKRMAECGFATDGELSMVYQPGWDKDQPLIRQLEEHLDRDLKLGHTGLGPHKADIRFAFNQKPVAEVFSRGQLKSLVAALYVAQIKVYQRYNPRSCLLLVDDLPAELDQENLKRLCAWLSQLDNVQIFITGVDLTSTLSYWPDAFDSKLFHVEQGQINERPLLEQTNDRA